MSSHIEKPIISIQNDNNCYEASVQYSDIKH